MLYVCLKHHMNTHAHTHAHTQVLQRCFRVTMERAKVATTLMDCKGCQLRVEPMVPIKELEKHLMTLVCGCGCVRGRSCVGMGV